MNHKWKDDVCTSCGCKREKRVGIYPYKDIDGENGMKKSTIMSAVIVWVFSFDNREWYYKSPDCVLKTDTKATAGKAPLRNRDDRGSAHGETDQPEATTPAL